jgi:transcriptional regulator GlxA family with amidase domain
VEKALDMLNTTDLPVEQISSMVGFSDKKQFYRQFKNYMGITPGAVRRGETGQI